MAQKENTEVALAAYALYHQKEQLPVAVAVAVTGVEMELVVLMAVVAARMKTLIPLARTNF